MRLNAANIENRPNPLHPYFLFILLKGAENDFKFVSLKPSPLSIIVISEIGLTFFSNKELVEVKASVDSRFMITSIFLLDRLTFIRLMIELTTHSYKGKNASPLYKSIVSIISLGSTFMVLIDFAG